MSKRRKINKEEEETPTITWSEEEDQMAMANPPQPPRGGASSYRQAYWAGYALETFPHKDQHGLGEACQKRNTSKWRKKKHNDNTTKKLKADPQARDDDNKRRRNLYNLHASSRLPDETTKATTKSARRDETTTKTKRPKKTVTFGSATSFPGSTTPSPAPAPFSSAAFSNAPSAFSDSSATAGTFGSTTSFASFPGSSTPAPAPFSGAAFPTTAPSDFPGSTPAPARFLGAAFPTTPTAPFAFSGSAPSAFSGSANIGIFGSTTSFPGDGSTILPATTSFASNAFSTNSTNTTGTGGSTSFSSRTEETMKITRSKATGGKRRCLRPQEPTDPGPTETGTLPSGFGEQDQDFPEPVLTTTSHQRILDMQDLPIPGHNVHTTDSDFSTDSESTDDDGMDFEQVIEVAGPLLDANFQRRTTLLKSVEEDTKTTVFDWQKNEQQHEAQQDEKRRADQAAEDEKRRSDQAAEDEKRRSDQAAEDEKRRTHQAAEDEKRRKHSNSIITDLVQGTEKRALKVIQDQNNDLVDALKQMTLSMKKKSNKKKRHHALPNKATPKKLTFSADAANQYPKENICPVPASISKPPKTSQGVRVGPKFTLVRVPTLGPTLNVAPTALLKFVNEKNDGRCLTHAVARALGMGTEELRAWMAALLEPNNPDYWFAIFILYWYQRLTPTRGDNGEITYVEIQHPSGQGIVAVAAEMRDNLLHPFSLKTKGDEEFYWDHRHLVLVSILKHQRISVVNDTSEACGFIVTHIHEQANNILMWMKNQDAWPVTDEWAPLRTYLWDSHINGWVLLTGREPLTVVLHHLDGKPYNSANVPLLDLNHFGRLVVFLGDPTGADIYCGADKYDNY